jgi:hypothetical protein
MGMSVPTGFRSMSADHYSREISRLALRAREAKISELQLRIQTLDAELATERAIVKHLRETGEDDV